MQSSPPCTVAHPHGQVTPTNSTALGSIPFTAKPAAAAAEQEAHLQNLRSARSIGRRLAMAAPGASVVVLAACLILLALGGGAEAQGGGVGQCVPQLNRLLACRAYLVPGAPDPSPDCCGALSAVSHECACSTMGIINSLPGRCNLAPVNC
ncbi:hypothetical protein BAE44_0007736, partial [Dichanthelium oligosanthes]